MKQRIGILLLTVWLAMFAMAGSATAQSATPENAATGSATAQNSAFILSVTNKPTVKGEQVVVTVTGTKLADVYGYELTLKYDEKKLLYRKSTSLLPGFSVPLDPVDGYVVFAHTKVGKTSGVSGKVELAAITFEPIGDSGVDGDWKTAVELTQVKLVKSNLASTELKPGTKVEVMRGEARIAETFSDLDGHWAKETVERAVGMGFVNGYGNGTFRPDIQITRAEFVAMAARAFELKAEGGISLQFSDVDEIPAWAKPYASEAGQAGIVTGYNDGSFRPDRPISRAEMAVMIMRLHGGKLDKDAKPAFADADLLESWAKPSIAAAAQLGVIQGKQGNRFDGDKSATRAEAAAMLLRLLDAMEKAAK
ncbi:S-layer homology domain-containing protein [Paenibacillus sp. CAU 1782]